MIQEKELWFQRFCLLHECSDGITRLEHLKDKNNIKIFQRKGDDSRKIAENSKKYIKMLKKSCNSVKNMLKLLMINS